MADVQTMAMKQPAKIQGISYSGGGGRLRSATNYDNVDLGKAMLALYKMYDKHATAEQKKQEEEQFMNGVLAAQTGKAIADLGDDATVWTQRGWHSYNIQARMNQFEADELANMDKYNELSPEQYANTLSGKFKAFAESTDDVEVKRYLIKAFGNVSDKLLSTQAKSSNEYLKEQISLSARDVIVTKGRAENGTNKAVLQEIEVATHGFDKARATAIKVDAAYIRMFEDGDVSLYEHFKKNGELNKVDTATRKKLDSAYDSVVKSKQEASKEIATNDYMINAISQGSAATFGWSNSDIQKAYSAATQADLAQASANGVTGDALIGMSYDMAAKRVIANGTPYTAWGNSISNVFKTSEVIEYDTNDNPTGKKGLNRLAMPAFNAVKMIYQSNPQLALAHLDEQAQAIFLTTLSDSEAGTYGANGSGDMMALQTNANRIVKERQTYTPDQITRLVSDPERRKTLVEKTTNNVRTTWTAVKRAFGVDSFSGKLVYETTPNVKMQNPDMVIMKNDEHYRRYLTAGYHPDVAAQMADKATRNSTDTVLGNYIDNKGYSLANRVNDEMLRIQGRHATKQYNDRRKAAEAKGLDPNMVKMPEPVSKLAAIPEEGEFQDLLGEYILDDDMSRLEASIKAANPVADTKRIKELAETVRKNYRTGDYHSNLVIFDDETSTLSISFSKDGRTFWEKAFSGFSDDPADMDFKTENLIVTIPQLADYRYNKIRKEATENRKMNTIPKLEPFGKQEK